MPIQVAAHSSGAPSITAEHRHSLERADLLTLLLCPGLHLAHHLVGLWSRSADAGCSQSAALSKGRTPYN